MSNISTNKFVPRVKLENINIGQTSGENEARNPQFESLFYTGNKKYSEICKKEKFIIRGRKGTGKTILAYYIKKKSKQNGICSCKINTLKDIELQKLVHLENREFLDEEYESFWRYCVLVELGRSILEKYNSFYILLNPKLRKLKKIIDSRNSSSLKLMEVNKVYNTSNKKSFDAKSVDSIKNKNLSSSKNFGFGVSREKNSGITEKYEVKGYFSDIENLEKLILNILSKEEYGYMIIYDDLDELGDNLDEHKKYKRLILGMIFAIQDLNNKIQEVNENSKVIISIRSDILDSLNKHSSNLRKIISDNSVNLYWLNKDCSHVTDNLLIDLILSKIQASVPEYKNIDKKTLFKSLFPKDISSKLTVHYLLDNSMGRPRQIIEFLNIIIRNYGNEIKFTPRQFRSCLKYFSIELYKDLENEFSVFENKEELNESLKLIRDLRKPEFKYREILAHYNVNKNQYKNITNVDNSLNLMYSFGVIGMYIKDDDKRHRVSWGYREDGDDHIDIDQTFLVHSALKPKFNIN
ncbi:P-loop ATPase, Sll1717 family [Romboutsia sp. 1001713B170131_170501_G6]|uniref:P-loop ATPase, Sll1717 family n=1 Tax=Romboutsia sp. 1001713B170131_170501_G6 TaxID=2787108 RepID=UPI0018AA7AF4|nr:hypothetical protein [Romboutsia sp. 1001713B170131_170501_G6]